MKNFLSRLCLCSLAVAAGGQQAFGELLLDSDFDGSADSAALRADSAGQDWYESRGHTPERLTLNTADIGGNTGKKAALTNFGVGGNAYLTQEFSSAQSARFVVSCDIYIDRIENNGNYDRSGLIYIGDDSISSNAPTGTSNERFVLLGFYDSTPGDTGDDLEIRVRTSSSQSWSTTSTWTSVATGLSYDTWYTVKLVIDVAGTFDLYVNDELRSANIPKYSGYSSSSIRLITFAAGSNGRGDFYVDNVSAQTVLPGPGDIVLDAAFDSGSVQSYSVSGDTVNVALRTETLVNTGAVYTYWANFKLSNVAGREVTLNFTGIDAVPFLAHQGPEENQMVYSCDGETWNRLTQHVYSSANGGTYTVTETFPCDEAQIATFFPFSYQRMQDFLGTVSLSQWATKTRLGASLQDRDIDLLTITNSAVPAGDKEQIYLIGRQHAAENSSSHMLEGMMEFLISTDPDAQIMRDQFVWYIVPMVNPDGVYMGNPRATSELRDPNRDWANDETVAVTIVRNHIDLIDSTYAIEMFIDWHSQMSDDRWHNFVYSPPGNTFFPVLSSWTDFDQESALGSSCSVGSCTSRGYATSIGLLTFVLEPTPHLSTWTTESLKQQGINTSYAIADYFGAFSLDTEPPSPDPATFAIPPTAIGTTEITMTATTGSDQSAPVEYYFAELSGNLGGSDSGWMTDPVYMDTGLVPGTEYSYTVQMRDSIGNVGGVSNLVSATTDPASAWTELTSDDFESGWGSYRDGGSDCRRRSSDSAFAHQGIYCARIRDNSGTRSSFYSTSGVDVATPGYTEITVEFWYYPRSMESGENFWVQYYDGSSWQTVANYVSGTDFSNGSFHHVVDLIIEEGAPYTFPTDMKIRFMCDASSNRDYVYVDEVVVSAQ